MRTLLHILMLVCLPLSSAQATTSVQVSPLGDFGLSDWGMTDPAINASIDLCVYGLGGNDYAVKVTQTGGYKLSGTGGNIPFTLSWDDGGKGNLGLGATALTNNVKLTGRSRANVVTPLCLSGPTARLNLNITQAAMQAALSGHYTGSIDIIVSVN